jgi:hypothetical protein
MKQERVCFSDSPRLTVPFRLGWTLIQLELSGQFSISDLYSSRKERGVSTDGITVADVHYLCENPRISSSIRIIRFLWPFPRKIRNLFGLHIITTQSAREQNEQHRRHVQDQMSRPRQIFLSSLGPMLIVGQDIENSPGTVG